MQERSRVIIDSVKSISETDGLSIFYNTVKEEENYWRPLELKNPNKLFPNFNWIGSMPCSIIEALAIGGPFEIQLFVLLYTKHHRCIIYPFERPESIDGSCAAYVEGLKQTNSAAAITIFERIYQSPTSLPKHKMYALLRLAQLYAQGENLSKAITYYKILLEKYYSELDPFSRLEIAKHHSILTKLNPNLKDFLISQFNEEIARKQPSLHILIEILKNFPDEISLYLQIFARADILFLNNFQNRGPYHRRETINFFKSLPEEIENKNHDFITDALHHLLENELRSNEPNFPNIELLCEHCFKIKAFNKKEKWIEIFASFNDFYQRNLTERRKRGGNLWEINLKLNQILEQFLDSMDFKNEIIECLLKNLFLESSYNSSSEVIIKFLLPLLEKHKFYENPQHLKSFLTSLLPMWNLCKFVGDSCYSHSCGSYLLEYLENLQKNLFPAYQDEFTIARIELLNKHDYLDIDQLEKAHQLILTLPEKHHLNPKTQCEIYNKLGDITNKKEYFIKAGNVESLLKAAKISQNEVKQTGDALKLYNQALQLVCSENNDPLFFKTLEAIFDLIKHNGGVFSADESYIAEQLILQAYTRLDIKKENTNFQIKLRDLAINYLPDIHFFTATKLHNVLELLHPFFVYNQKFLEFAFQYSGKEEFNPKKIFLIDQQLEKILDIRKPAINGIEQIIKMLANDASLFANHSDMVAVISQSFFLYLKYYIDSKKLTKQDLYPLVSSSSSHINSLLLKVINKIQYTVTKENIFKCVAYLYLVDVALKKGLIKFTDYSEYSIQVIKLLPASPLKEELATHFIERYLDPKINKKSSLMTITQFDFDMSQSTISDPELTRLGLPLSLANLGISKIDTLTGNNLKKIYLSALLQFVSGPSHCNPSEQKNVNVVNLVNKINQLIPKATMFAKNCFAKMRTRYNSLIKFYDSAIAAYSQSPFHNPHLFLLDYLDNQNMNKELRQQVLEGMKLALGFKEDGHGFEIWITKLYELIPQIKADCVSQLSPLALPIPSAPGILNLEKKEDRGDSKENPAKISMSSQQGLFGGTLIKTSVGDGKEVYVSPLSILIIPEKSVSPKP